MNKKRAKKSSKGQAGRSPAPARETAAALSSTGPRPEAARAVDQPQAVAGGVLRKVAAVLFGAAFGIAVYLAWQSLAGKAMPGCGPESGCGHILNSRWSVLGTVPVSLFGAAAYAVLLVSALCAGLRSRWHRRLEWGASLLVLGGALWFTIVQAFILKAFCPWCCAAHFLASAGVVALWYARRRVPESSAARHGLAEFALPLAAVAGMAILQSRSEEPERIVEKTLTESVVAGPGTLSLYGGRLMLDSATLPSLGWPEAADTAVALTDFTCPNCRELHQTLTGLVRQRPGQFRIVLLPAAFEPEARELHRIMLSLWRVDPEGYWKVAEELAAGSIHPKVNEVLAAVQTQMNGRFYELAWAQADWVQATLRKGEELMALNGKEAGASTLPQLMIRDRVLSGAPHASTLAALLDAVPLPATTAVAASLPPPAAAPTKAMIAFDSTTVDLGTVTRGEAATKKVTFTNSGSEPLTVSSVKASCGCTTIAGWQQTVAPGKQGSFELKLDSGRFFGEVSKTVDVESNAANGSVRLTLRAKIWTPVALNPPAVSFGMVIKGTKIEPRVIEITVTEPEPLKLGPITCSNPFFLTELKTIEEGRRYQLKVSVPEPGENPQNADLVLELGHPRMKDMKFPVFVNPVDPVTVQPAEFIRPATTLKTSPTTSVTVFCYDPALATLEVTDLAYSGGGGVTVKFERQGNTKGGRINLTFPPEFDPAAAKDTQVTFRTNHRRYPLMTVPVRFMLPAPAVAPPVSGSPQVNLPLPPQRVNP